MEHESRVGDGRLQGKPGQGEVGPHKKGVNTAEARAVIEPTACEGPVALFGTKLLRTAGAERFKVEDGRIRGGPHHRVTLRQQPLFPALGIAVAFIAHAGLAG